MLYPLKFSPILKDKIWGGRKLVTEFNKTSKSSKVGESWEISSVPGDVSVVSNGELKGKSLQELIDTYTSELLGIKNFERFGNEFPLLIKFIDANQDLSVQLHPDDKLAKKRHNSFGKTEMWYVMNSDENAKLMVGFNQPITKDIYQKHLEDKTLPEILNYDTVKEGDTYFIEAGRIHAIGAGVLLAEIQQTSDVTYRVYDWDRVDDHGNYRELHNDIAIDAFKFELEDDFRVTYTKHKNADNTLVHCPFFKTNFLDLDTDFIRKNEFDSFIIYMCTDGRAEFLYKSEKFIISKGESILIPANIPQFSIETTSVKLLEVFI